MKIKKLTAEIHTTYQTMVDAVEEFVVKEGKTVQQAFNAAEEKLHELSEISKDEIDQVSQDLKENLRLMGENVEGASEAYKEQIKLNMAFVNSTIWDKLLKTSDSSTAQLAQFTRALKEEAQAVTTGEHLSAHQEHSQWSAEYGLWLSEANLWKKEHDQAIHKLKDIETALKQQSAALHEHIQVIQSHEARDHEHETAMADAEKDPSSEDYKAADEGEATVHERERKIRVKHAEMHRVFKVHHYKMMGMINLLYKKANEPY